MSYQLPNDSKQDDPNSLTTSVKVALAKKL